MLGATSVLPQNSPYALPILDIAAARKMLELDERGFAEVLKKFTASIEPKVRALAGHFAAGNMTQVQSSVHRIKGTGQYIQANQLVSLSSELESYLLRPPEDADGWNSAVQERIEHLVAAFDRVQALVI